MLQKPELDTSKDFGLRILWYTNDLEVYEFKKIFYGSIVDLQCVNFCCTAK